MGGRLKPSLYRSSGPSWNHVHLCLEIHRVHLIMWIQGGCNENIQAFSFEDFCW